MQYRWCSLEDSLDHRLIAGDPSGIKGSGRAHSEIRPLRTTRTLLSCAKARPRYSPGVKIRLIRSFIYCAAFASALQCLAAEGSFGVKTFAEGFVSPTSMVPLPDSD